jgi:hypothetical protein
MERYGIRIECFELLSGNVCKVIKNLDSKTINTIYV